MLQLQNTIEWKPALGKNISDHPWGSICKDSEGQLFLIGDTDGNDTSGGCGCCSHDLTNYPIVEYAIIVTIHS